LLWFEENTVRGTVNTPLPSSPPPTTIVILRIAVAILLGIHGHYRAWTGGAWNFGEYLASVGIPLGTVIAWTITVFEIVASPLLAAGKFVRIVVPGFALILTGGIIMVHGREGWFVVGGGRNGVEYSLLLIVTLVVLFLAHPPTARQKTPSAAKE
jgi:putative oxidoreductase